MSSIRIRFLALGTIAALVGSFGLAGCKPEATSESKSRRKEGVITRVDLPRGRLAMKIRDEKEPGRFLDKEIEGMVTPTTEIFINSERAELKDLQLNDRVTAIGHTRGEGDSLEIVAEELKIERGTAAAPATGGEAQPRATATQTPPTPAPHAGGTESVPPQPPVAAAPSDSNSAAGATPPTKPAARPDMRSARIDLYMRLVDEFQRKRQELVTQRDAMLKQGTPATDDAIRDLENKINRADESIAMIEQKAAEEASGSAAASSAPAPKPAAETQPSGG